MVTSSSKKSENTEGYACVDPSRDRLLDNCIQLITMLTMVQETLNFSSALGSFGRTPMASSVVTETVAKRSAIFAESFVALTISEALAVVFVALMPVLVSARPPALRFAISHV